MLTGIWVSIDCVGGMGCGDWCEVLGVRVAVLLCDELSVADGRRGLCLQYSYIPNEFDVFENIFTIS